VFIAQQLILPTFPTPIYFSQLLTDFSKILNTDAAHHAKKIEIENKLEISCHVYHV
jgi:hypothetical protein